MEEGFSAKAQATGKANPMNKIISFGTFSLLAAGLWIGSISCNKPQTAQQESQSAQAPATSTDQTQPASGDPAQANLASTDQNAANYPPPQPASSGTYPAGDQGSSGYQDAAYDTGDTDSDEPPVYADQPPPPLPEYSQPECPGENYEWTPGYWANGSQGYYWVPGAWVLAPFVGALWTPPYWSYSNNRYRWHHGYWGSHVGFYGGVNYGFGYVGRGYEGGYWHGNDFDYNRSVNNVNTTVVRNVYDYRVTNYTTNRVSYDGGPGGLNARPTVAEVAVLHEQRIAPVPAQVQHMQQAQQNRAQFAAVNHGRPQEVAAARPLPTAYKAPAAAPTAVPGARPMARVNPPAPAPASRNEPNARPGQPNPQPAPARPEERPAARGGQPTPAKPEERPGARPGQPAPATRPGQPAPATRPEARPTPHAAQPAPGRPEERPAPHAAQPAPHAAQPAPHGTEPAPHATQPAGGRPAEHPAPAGQPKQEPSPAARSPHPAAQSAPAPHGAPPAREQRKETSRDTKDTKH
jgi:hypothetical protein